MTTQELISKLRELDEKASVGLDYQHYYGGSDVFSKEDVSAVVGTFGLLDDAIAFAELRNNLPRIIRLLEAGEQMAATAKDYAPHGDRHTNYCNISALTRCSCPNVAWTAALSAYEEAGK